MKWIRYIFYVIGAFFSSKWVIAYLKESPIINKIKIKKWSSAGKQPVLDKPLTDKEIDEEITKLNSTTDNN